MRGPDLQGLEGLGGTGPLARLTSEAGGRPAELETNLAGARSSPASQTGAGNRHRALRHQPRGKQGTRGPLFAIRGVAISDWGDRLHKSESSRGTDS